MAPREEVETHGLSTSAMRVVIRNSPFPHMLDPTRKRALILLLLKGNTNPPFLVLPQSPPSPWARPLPPS